MKVKIIKLASLLLGIIVCMSFSKVQAQTKKETIDWLKEKLEKYAEVLCENTYKKATNINIDACKIVFSYHCNNKIKTYTLLVNEIKSIRENGCFDYCFTCFDEYKNEFENSGVPKVEKSKIEKSKKDANNKKEEVVIDDGNLSDFEDADEKSIFEALSIYAKTKSSSYSVKILNGEKNIYSRIGKALKHLATFCPDKKEPF